MITTRRTFLKSAATGMAASVLPFRLAEAADTVKVGGLNDLSGNMTYFGSNKHRCSELAIEEINAAGGLLGKKLEYVNYDTQSNNQLYAQYAQTLGLRDRVAVVHGGLTSSSREIVRPIFNRTRTLYFYNMPYEGGVCDRNTFNTGTTPGQLLANLLPHCIKTFGPKIYVLGADYNFGHISAKWTQALAKEHGGEVIGTDFFPLDVSQFGPTISKIQQAKPDFIVNTFVGPAHAAFYGQWVSAGMKKEIPIASQTFGEAGEHVRMPKEVSEGITVCYMYLDELDTPENKAFLARFKKKFGEEYGYLGDLPVSSYQGWHLWAEGVRKAGSFDREKVITALETGISFDGPSGRIAIDPPTHHCVFDMHLAHVVDGKLEVIKKFDQVKPTNPGGRCDLIENPNTNAQFEPDL